MALNWAETDHVEWKFGQILLVFLLIGPVITTLRVFGDSLRAKGKHLHFSQYRSLWPMSSFASFYVVMCLDDIVRN